MLNESTFPFIEDSKLWLQGLEIRNNKQLPNKQNINVAQC